MGRLLLAISAVSCFLGCVATVPRPAAFMRAPVDNPREAFKKIIASLSQDGFSIEVAEIEAGVLNTGWKTFGVVRGLAKVTSSVRERVQIVFSDSTMDVRVTFQCHYMASLYSGGFMDCLVGDEAEPQLKKEEDRLISLVRKAAPR